MGKKKKKLKFLSSYFTYKSLTNYNETYDVYEKHISGYSIESINLITFIFLKNNYKILGVKEKKKMKKSYNFFL